MIDLTKQPAELPRPVMKSVDEVVAGDIIGSRLDYRKTFRVWATWETDRGTSTSPVTYVAYSLGGDIPKVCTLKQLKVDGFSIFGDEDGAATPTGRTKFHRVTYFDGFEYA